MIDQTMKNLLRSRQFFPMFITMLTTVVNDSILRSSFILLLTFGSNTTGEASSTWADFIVAADHKTFRVKDEGYPWRKGVFSPA